jgi:hypothetical protein
VAAKFLIDFGPGLQKLIDVFVFAGHSLVLSHRLARTARESHLYMPGP